MSMAPRAAKWMTWPSSCAGHESPFVQTWYAPSRSTAAPHTGHFAGMANARVPRGRFSFSTSTTSGMTSPARRTRTVSPTRTSLRSDLVLVVQRGARDRDARDVHRLERRHRRELPGAPDLHDDVEHLRDLDARRELEGHRPARRARAHAEQVLPVAAVHLDDHAVDLVVERVALRRAARRGSASASSMPSADAHVLLDVEAPAAQGVERLGLRRGTRGPSAAITS